MKKKAQLAKKKPDFWEADLVHKSRAFGIFAMKKSTFLESEAKKSPTFGEADSVHKSRAFGNFARKKPNFWMLIFVQKSWAFACFLIEKVGLLCNLGFCAFCKIWAYFPLVARSIPRHAFRSFPLRPKLYLQILLNDLVIYNSLHWNIYHLLLFSLFRLYRIVMNIL